MKSYIHLIRHGITEGVQKRWFYGSVDIPLVDEGITALNELKDKGTYPEAADADFYTSGMLRTNQTLHVLYGDVPHKEIPLLREMNFGRWECRTYEELKDEPEHDEWMADRDGSFTYPGGDSIKGFYVRVREGLKELTGCHRMKELAHRHDGKDAVSIIICHGGIISVAMDTWFPGDRENFWQWVPSAGRGFSVEFEDGEPVRYSEI